MALKVVYLLCGVSGSGKSWVIDNIAFTGTKIKSDLLKDTNALISAIMNSTSDVVVVEKTALISTFITSMKGRVEMRPVMVAGDFLQVKQQLINRGGKITKGLYRRWNRMKVLYNNPKYGFTFIGDSVEVKKHLDGLI